MDSSTLTASLLSLNPNPNPSASRPSATLRCRRPFSLPIRCLQSPPSGPTPLSRPAASRAPAPAPPETISSDLPRHRLRRLADEFRSLPEPIDRVKRLLDYASSLPLLPELDHNPANRVMGCTAQVWVSASIDPFGRMHFAADSDSEITKGFCSCLISVLDGATPEEVLEMRPDDFGDLNVVGMPGRAHSRANTWHNVLISMQKRTKALVAQGEGRPQPEPFPSLVIGADGIQAKGSYAEAQEN